MACQIITLGQLSINTLSSNKWESVEKVKEWLTGGGNHMTHERNHIAGATESKAVNEPRAA